MSMQPTRAGDSFLRKSLKWCRFVALSIDELVVDNLDVGVVRWKENDLVGNCLSIREGGNILSNTSKAQNDILPARSAQLGLALLTQHNDIGIWLLNEHLANTLAQSRVNTTA